MKTGIDLITQERKEQIEKHGYGEDHDSQHTNRELLSFAMYCITGDEIYYPHNWNTPCKLKMFKKERIDQLAIAGAVIAAEIDRMQGEQEPEFEDLNQKK